MMPQKTSARAGEDKLDGHLAIPVGQIEHTALLVEQSMLVLPKTENVFVRIGHQAHFDAMQIGTKGEVFPLGGREDFAWWFFQQPFSPVSQRRKRSLPSPWNSARKKPEVSSAASPQQLTAEFARAPATVLPAIL
jgi:hypothetical protein